jgi:hypothetical protein
MKHPTYTQPDSTSKTVASHELNPIRQPAIRSAKPTLGRRTAPRKAIPPARPHDTGDVTRLNETHELVADEDGLATLVWRYFESELREALIEVQDSFAHIDSEPSQKPIT